MLTVSDDFNNAMKAENRRFETRIKVGDKVFTKNDINSWVYSGGSISGETFQIGSTFSNSIKIEFCSILENIKELTEVTVEVGIATYDADFNYTNIPPAQVGRAQVGSAKLIHYKPTVYEYVPLGTFYVTTCDPDRNEKKTTLEASDRFLFMGNEYVSELKYPAKIRDVALEIANKSGMKINETNFSMISTTTIGKPEGYTYRQAIGLIAQFEAGYARFNRNNELEVKQLIDPKFSVSPYEYFQKGLTKNELMYKVGGISCTVSVKSKSGDEQVTYTSGSNTGPQIVLDNKVMTQSQLDNIYQKVKDLNFYPFTLNWRGNPALETGDWLTLTDRDGTLFKTPNLSYTLTFKGGLTATSSANTNSSAQTISAYTPPLQQIVKDFNSRIDAAGKNSVYDGTEEPPYPKEGDIWFKKNGPDDEIWIYTKLADGTYDWVMTTSTKLSDEIQEKINNSVPSDEIVKTINLSQEMDGKEWLKIKGAKIWLTEETRIDDAIIKDAMIGNLSASKLSTGTLNAANVNIINLNASNISTGTLNGNKINVINLNASNIVAGTIKGENLSISLDTGAVQFQKGFLTGDNNLIRLDMDKSYFHSFDSKGSGFKINGGQLSFFDGFWGRDSNYLGSIMLDVLSSDFSGLKVYGQKGASIQGGNHSIMVGYSILGNNKIGLSGDTGVTGNLSVLGSKNAAHATRDGIRLTPAYETAESYLGDIGTAETGEDCTVIVPIEEHFSD
ncbi:MAG: gp58-like family protein, partial [Lactobacillus sp.]|nr:gp58-like family protein [Lactobacillus sp.]